MSKVTAIAVSLFVFSTTLFADCLLRGVQYLETGSERSSIAVADFNRDGHPDIALTGENAGALRVFLNQKDGSFTLSVEKQFKPAPTIVQSADFNGDLLADLAVATRNSVIILNNEGNSRFTVAQYIRVQEVIAMAAVDMNSDSRADLALLRRIGTEAVISVYQNTREGFRPVQSLAAKFATDLIAAKLGSGRTVDLVATNERGTLMIFKGTSAGVFQPPVSTQTVPGAARVVAGFINGDTQIDLVVAGADGRFAVMLGKNETEFQRLLVSTGSDIEALALGDFDDDSPVDLLLINRNSRTSIFSGDGHGKFRFTRGFAYGLFTGPVIGADFNNDGLGDFAAAERGAAGIFLRTGSGTFATGARTVLKGGGNIFAGDFDADGNADLLVSETMDSFFLKGKGDGSFLPAQKTVLPQIGYAAVADFNGDGQADLAGFDRLNLKAWLSDGRAVFQESDSIPLSVDPPVQSLDLNGDGIQDLAVMMPRTLVIFLGLGNGTFTRVQPIRFDSEERGTLADLNGDGAFDLIGINTTKGKETATIYLGATSLSFTKYAQVPIGECPGGVSAGDANGDGNADVVIGSTCGNKVTLLFGDGHGGFSASRKVPSGLGSTNPHLIDLNNDGKAEIVALAGSLGKPSITIAPEFSDYRVLGPFYWDHLAVADFDRDGKPDLAASSFNSTAVFLNCH